MFEKIGGDNMQEAGMRGLFADELRADPSLFVIEANLSDDINAIERKYLAKFVIGETTQDGRFFALLKKWGDISLEVSVWNCRATVLFRNDAGASVDYKVLDPKLDEQLEQLANDSVYDADGAINWSGIYPPNSDLIRTFRQGIAEGKITFENERSDKVGGDLC